MALLFIFALLFRLSGSLLGVPPSQAQSDCFNQTIANNEVLAQKSLDLDQDGKLDQVIVYGQGDLYVLIATDSDSPNCKVVLNEYLIHRQLITGRQLATIKSIEPIEITGESPPELYVSVETKGGGPRVEYATHAIYSAQNGQWREILHFSQCLTFSSFEFRDNPTSHTKDVYADEDRHCEPPWSSSRTYTLLRWDGAKFAAVESGTSAIRETNPPEADLICLMPFVVLIVVWFGFWLLYHIRRIQKQG